MKIFEIPFESVSLDRTEIYRAMGMGSDRYVPDPDMIARVDSIMAEVAGVCRIRFGYRLYPSQGITQKQILLGDQALSTGSVITRYLKGAEFFALFVATAGGKFDEWLHGLKQSGDILREYIGDAIGSEIAEFASRAASGELEREAASRGMGASNSYSPGYCGWHVSDQQALFALLPASPCGITLSQSSLMSPIKSVSGVIALGRNVQKMPYGCEICERKDCYKQKLT